jgi:hypothetical protein
LRYRIDILLFTASSFIVIAAAIGLALAGIAPTSTSVNFGDMRVISRSGAVTFTNEDFFTEEHFTQSGSYYGKLGFACGSYDTTVGKLQWMVRLPYWALILIPTVAAVWSLRDARRLARIAHMSSRGLVCPNCGYDLHGTPDRCPECGWRSVEALLRRGNDPR